MKRWWTGRGANHRAAVSPLRVLITLTRHLYAMPLKNGLKPWRVFLDDLIALVFQRQIVFAHDHRHRTEYISGEPVAPLSGNAETIRPGKSLK